MQSLIMGALGLEENRSGREMANVIARRVRSKSLQRQIPELIDGMARDPSFPDDQRRELVHLLKGRLPKELVGLGPAQFQQRLGQAGVSPPMASSVYLVLELELLNHLEDQDQAVQPVAAKAVKKGWPGADQVQELAKDWKESLVKRRYDLAHRLQLIQGQGPRLKVTDGTASEPEPGTSAPAGAVPEPQTAPGPRAEGSSLPELKELTSQAPEPSTPSEYPEPPEPPEHPKTDRPFQTSGPTGPSNAGSMKSSPTPTPNDESLKTYSGQNYKLFIGGKGIPILEFTEQGPGEALVTTKEPHPVLEDWLARGDPAVLYVIEKSGSETHPLQGCKVLEARTVYKLVYRVNS